MNELQAQLVAVETELDNEKAKGAARDTVRIDALEKQQADILKAMDDAKALEAKVQADDVPFVISGVDLSKATPELIDFVEKVVKADRRRIYAEHASELDNLHDGHDEEIKEYENKVIARDGQLEHLDSINNEQKAAIVRLTTERDEALKLRDNAAAQIVEKDVEIDRLKSQIDDYQKAKVFGEREAQNIIETEPSEADEIQAALQKLLYVSVENWGSTNKVIKPDGSFELVKNKDLDQWTAITPPTLFGGSDATSTFQGDTEAQPQDTGSDTPTPPTLVGDTFREETEVSNDLNVNGVDEGDARGEVAPEPGMVTRAEFETLQARVAKLESAA